MKATISAMCANLFFVANVAAQPCFQDEPNVVSDSTAPGYAGMGSAVDMSGDVLVAGVPGGGDFPTSGAAYIYQRDGSQYVLQKKALPIGQPRLQAFGNAVATDGQRVIVGAAGEAPDGEPDAAAYIYVRNNGVWELEQRLVAADAELAEGFGAAVDIEGEIAIVGAPFNSSGPHSYGAVHVFKLDGTEWVETDRLIPQDGIRSVFVGCDVEIHGNRVAVGAYGTSQDALWGGSALVFHFDGTTWSQEGRLSSPKPTEYAKFGYSVSIHDDTVAVGEVFNSIGSPDHTGQVHIFTYTESGWQAETNLVPDDGLVHDSFGYDVAVFGDFALIGAPRHHAAGEGSGAAYLYKRAEGQWGPVRKLVPEDTLAGDGTGQSLILSGGLAAIGAPAASSQNDNPGRVLVYQQVCEETCPADTNHDFVLTPADFTYWVFSFYDNSPECDQNNDGVCEPTDFTAWINNYQQGCP